ncbi:uncharacterized protein V6R79_016926 [Siganus canaliculatus]
MHSLSEVIYHNVHTFQTALILHCKNLQSSRLNLQEDDIFNDNLTIEGPTTSDDVKTSKTRCVLNIDSSLGLIYSRFL